VLLSLLSGDGPVGNDTDVDGGAPLGRDEPDGNVITGADIVGGGPDGNVDGNEITGADIVGGEPQ
tara:strand:- start:456 stop:650 length:195 start_codon:yes stop_codon:yes gene_type:complete